MWYEHREFSNPYWNGYLVQEKVKCGKISCHCMKGGKRHLAFYLYWRDYFPQKSWILKDFNKAGSFEVRNTPRLRKKYIPKKDVSKVQRQIALIKGMTVLTKMPIRQIAKFMDNFSSYEEDERFIQAYVSYGSSKATKWLNWV